LVSYQRRIGIDSFWQQKLHPSWVGVPLSEAKTQLSCVCLFLVAETDVPGGGGCFRPATKGRRKTKETAALLKRAPLALDNDRRFGTVVKADRSPLAGGCSGAMCQQDTGKGGRVLHGLQIFGIMS
jgi:hypothetical protein